MTDLPTFYDPMLDSCAGKVQLPLASGEAAALAKIAALTEEVERLRSALEAIASGNDSCVQFTSMPPRCARKYRARTALGKR